jgi:hypothetical protein
MAMTRATIILSVLLAGTAASEARDCRAPASDLPGVRLQPPPGCEAKQAGPRARGRERVRQGSDPGFIDLGNGSQVKISGSVRVDVRSRR